MASPDFTRSPCSLCKEALCLYTDKNPLACSKIITKPVSAVNPVNITVPSATALTGGQNKVPRLSNDRKIAETLKKWYL